MLGSVSLAGFEPGDRLPDADHARVGAHVPLGPTDAIQGCGHFQQPSPNFQKIAVQYLNCRQGHSAPVVDGVGAVGSDYAVGEQTLGPHFSV